MDEETKKIIDDQFKALPKGVQDAILHSSWNTKIHELSKKYQLHLDQENDLVNGVFLVLLGLELTDDFKNNLINDVGIKKEQVDQILNDINEIIFKPIKEELQSLNNEIKDLEKDETKTTAQDIIPKREDILKGIEDPEIIPPQIPLPPAQTTNLIEDKISKVVHLPQETVDNSKTSKIPSPKPPSTDPYREPLI